MRTFNLHPGLPVTAQRWQLKPEVFAEYVSASQRAETLFNTQTGEATRQPVVFASNLSFHLSLFLP